LILWTYRGQYGREGDDLQRSYGSMAASYFDASSQRICRSIAAAQSSVSNLPVLPATGMNATSPFG
jgi:hypothetical protein